MATTGIWKIEKRLDHVIDYVVNPEKTTKADYQELHKLDEYSNSSYNTEEECYVSALNTAPYRAYKDMMNTKDMVGKKDGILAYHAFQSFVEGEVTPDQAHLIGMRLAEEMWGDRFEVIVSTHINTNHIHNHFVINSVSFKDGKKYYATRESYALLRHTSDAICNEYGLNVLDPSKCKKGKVNYENYYKNYVSHSNYHTMAKEDIDKAISMAQSYKEFENIMHKMGYEITNRYGKLSIKREPYKKNIRIERAFGEDYSIDRINTRIELTEKRDTTITRSNPNNTIYYRKEFEKAREEKKHGIYGLYKYYCYILKIYPKQYTRKLLTPALRLEVQRMNEISEQTRMLVANKIETYEQLMFYKNSLVTDVSILTSEKENLWKKIKRVSDEESKKDIMFEIETISSVLDNKKKEVRLCDGVIERLNVVKENIQEFEEKERKERKNEF